MYKASLERSTLAPHAIFVSYGQLLSSRPETTGYHRQPHPGLILETLVILNFMNIFSHLFKKFF